MTIGVDRRAAAPGASGPGTSGTLPAAPGSSGNAVMFRTAAALSSILVVDDIEWNRLLIGTILQSAGYSNLRFAADGIEALTLIAEERPDLLVLDIMMPRMDGFEVCRRLRSESATADLPILVQTALTGVDDRNQAFEAGTTDLVCKPLDRAELLARVRIHLENRLLLRDLQQYRARIEAEMMTARAVFTHLLPSQQTLAAVRDSHGITVRFHMIQASALGGDIWGVRAIDETRLAVYLMDLPGRGVSAALNACRIHTLLHDVLDETTAPDRVLATLNDRSVELFDSGGFVAVFSAVIDIAERTLRFAGAAFQNFLLYRPGEAAHLIQASGIPLGVVPAVEFAAADQPLPGGSVLLLLSNAVFDALDRMEQAGNARPDLGSLVDESLAAGDAPAAFEQVRSTIAGWLQRPLDDDHTLLWLEVT